MLSTNSNHAMAMHENDIVKTTKERKAILIERKITSNKLM